MCFEISGYFLGLILLWFLSPVEVTNEMDFIDIDIDVDWIFNLETHCYLLVDSAASFFIFHYFTFPVATASVIHI